MLFWAGCLTHPWPLPTRTPRRPTHTHTAVTTDNTSRHGQMSPRGQKCASLRIIGLGIGHITILANESCYYMSTLFYFMTVWYSADGMTILYITSPLTMVINFFFNSLLLQDYHEYLCLYVSPLWGVNL